MYKAQRYVKGTTGIACFGSPQKRSPRWGERGLLIRAAFGGHLGGAGPHYRVVRTNNVWLGGELHPTKVDQPARWRAGSLGTRKTRRTRSEPQRGHFNRLA